MYIGNIGKTQFRVFRGLDGSWTGWKQRIASIVVSGFLENDYVIKDLQQCDFLTCVYLI